MNEIRILEKNQIPPSQLQYYFPVDAKTLREAGYNIDCSKSGIVYLDGESYKVFMNSQYFVSSSEKIDNFYPTEEIKRKR